MPLKRLFGLAALLMSLAALPGRAQNNYYVATTGSDSNNGLTSGTAWATITHAATSIALGASGTVVHVASGTYGNQTITNAHPGTSNSVRVVYISDVKWGAQIVGSGSGTASGFAFEDDAYFSDIQNFDVSGTPCGGLGLGAQNQRAIANNVHNGASSSCITVAGSGIDSFGFFSAGAANNQFLANFVHDVGIGLAGCADGNNSGVQGIYSSGKFDIIENNISIGNCQWGIHLWHNVSNVIVTNNTVIGNHGGGIIIGSGNCNPSPCQDTGTYVGNNLVAGNHFGISTFADGSTGGSLGTNTFAYNMMYSNATGDMGGATCSNCITGQNPLFVNNTGTSSGDYHLQSGSPAIGAGTTTNAPSTDFDGVARVAPITIGAYQFNTTLPTIPTFTANPTTITPGSSSTLSWTTTNATSVSISPP